MKILMGGVRGTSPRAEAEFTRYGGHTTSLLVTGRNGERVLLDAGSGVHTIAPHLGEVEGESLLLLLSHFHLDHLLGFPLLPPLFHAGAMVEVFALENEDAPMAETLGSLVAPPLWPLRLDEFPATIELNDIPRAVATPDQVLVTFGDLVIRAVSTHHPDGGTAWRIDEEGSEAGIVYATDVEWGLADETERNALLALCRTPRPADLLIMDGHFTDAEIEAARGWGHSTIQEAVEVARAGEVKRLLITHHAPENDDAQLDTMNDAVHALWSEASLARQGDEIEFGS